MCRSSFSSLCDACALRWLRTFGADASASQSCSAPQVIAFKLGKFGDATLRYKPTLEGTKPVLITYPIPFDLSVEPEGGALRQNRSTKTEGLQISAGVARTELPLTSAVQPLSPPLAAQPIARRAWCVMRPT